MMRKVLGGVCQLDAKARLGTLLPCGQVPPNKAQPLTERRLDTSATVWPDSLGTLAGFILRLLLRPWPEAGWALWMEACW